MRVSIIIRAVSFSALVGAVVALLRLARLPDFLACRYVPYGFHSNHACLSRFISIVRANHDHFLIGRLHLPCH